MCDLIAQGVCRGLGGSGIKVSNSNLRVLHSMKAAVSPVFQDDFVHRVDRYHINLETKVLTIGSEANLRNITIVMYAC